MAHDVFVSYSSKDKTVADAVCATLEQRGIRCWIAPRDILPGTDWGEGIIEGIEGSRLMVLVFSSNANSSQQIKREVERAVAKGLPIVPIRIENVVPERSLEYFLSTPHWLDALTPPLEQHLSYIAETVQVLLDRPADGSMPTPPARPSRPMAAPIRSAPRKAPAQTKPVLIAVAALIVAVGGFFAIKSLTGGGGSPPAAAGTASSTGVDAQLLGSWNATIQDGTGSTIALTSNVSKDGTFKGSAVVTASGVMTEYEGSESLTPTGGTLAGYLENFDPTKPPDTLPMYGTIPVTVWNYASLVTGGYYIVPDLQKITGTKMTGLPAGTVGYSADALIGTKPWKITFQYTSNVYKFRAEMDNGGVFSAGDGHFKLIPTTGQVAQGDYRLLDPNTLVLTGTQTPTVAGSGNALTGFIGNQQWKKAN